MKTFMIGTTGDGTGRRLEGEKNTYLEMTTGGLRQGSGIIRLTAEEEILDLCCGFKVESIDHVIRSDKNQMYEIKEWIVVCRKS